MLLPACAEPAVSAFLPQRHNRSDMRLTNGYYEIPPGKIAAVVTYLEMHDKPSPPPADRQASWQLRAVPRPDSEWYRDLYRRIGESWLWFSRLLLSDEDLEAVLKDPGIRFFAFQVGERDEGIIELDFRQKGECELAFFGITAALQGKGAGRWLMAHALALAWSQPIQRLWLHTCTADHPKALSFYQRAGFRPYRRAVEVADDPRLMDGVMPRQAAPHVPLL